MPDKRFDEMSAAEAQAYFDAYVAAGPARIQWLREKTGLALERTPESLVALWSWFLDWARAGGTHEPMEGLPMWCFPSREDEREPLRWDDPRADAISGRPPLPPAAAWFADAASYFLVEVLQTAVPRLHYRLYRDDPRNINFNQPVIDTGDAAFIEQSPPLTIKWCDFALAPRSGWQAKVREPETVLHRFQHYVDQAEQAAAELSVESVAPKTGRELLEHHRRSRLWDVELVADDEDGQLQVSFDDQVVHLASAVIDGLVEDLAAAPPPGVRDVYRSDREIVVIEAETEPGELDRARLEGAIDERMAEHLRDLRDPRTG